MISFRIKIKMNSYLFFKNKKKQKLNFSSRRETTYFQKKEFPMK